MRWAEFFNQMRPERAGRLTFVEAPGPFRAHEREQNGGGYRGRLAQER
jgi:hypothetical protein